MNPPAERPPLKTSISAGIGLFILKYIFLQSIRRKTDFASRTTSLEYSRAGITEHF